MTGMPDEAITPASFLQQMREDPARGVPGAAPGYGEQAIPHVHTVGGRHGIVSSSYLNMDEATRDSASNAERMRADCAIMECLEARQRATALLSWHIEPQDEADTTGKQLAAAMTDLVQETPRFTEMRRNLLEAIWYGRYATAMQYRRKRVGSQWRSVVHRWEPRHGDKLKFRYDDGSHSFDPDQVGIKVHTSYRGARMHTDPRTGQLVSKVTPTEQGLVYWFDRWERDTVIVHKHMIEDGPYGDPLMAGRIHGVGVRDRIYWTWYAMVECLQRVVEYLDRAAFGIEIWPYQTGNPRAKAETEAAATQAMGGGRTVILAPLPPDEQPERYMPHLIEPGLGGVSTTMDIIRTYFGHKIKRYILGQTLTSEADATGMGSGVADAHMATFADIVDYDAGNLSETLTTDFVRVIQQWNFPGTEHIRLKMRLDTEAPNVQGRMQAMKSAWDMGARIKASEVYDIIGAAMPDQGDETLVNPQIAAASQPMAGMSGPGGAPPQPNKPLIIDIEKMANELANNYRAVA